MMDFGFVGLREVLLGVVRWGSVIIFGSVMAGSNWAIFGSLWVRALGIVAMVVSLVVVIQLQPGYSCPGFLGIGNSHRSAEKFTSFSPF